jgi:hypothetical protein
MLKQSDVLKQIEEEMAKLERIEKLKTCLAADNLKSLPTEGQSVIFKSINSPARYRVCQGGNQSGKTTVSMRDLVWVLYDTHPYWTRPINHICNNKSCRNEDTEQFGDPTVPRYRCPKCQNIWEPWGESEPINIILCGESRTNIHTNLWESRIKPLLPDPQNWKEVKIGAFVAWVEHRINGNKILFFPHSKGDEQSRKSVQGFTVHFIYLDELAPVVVLEELMRRVDAKLGYLLAAFTMKKVDPDMLRFLSKQFEAGVAQLFRISKLDNPKYTGMKDIILAQLSGLTKEQKDAYLYGDAGEASDKVFKLDYALMKSPIPANYSKGWKHAVIVDPACLSKAGFAVIAKNPQTENWHVIRAEYWPGMEDPADLIDKVEYEIRHYNIVWRVCDNQAWYYGPARKRGIIYKCPPNKQKKEGKLYIIKKAQTFFNSGRMLIAEGFEDLWNELDSYRWNDDGKNIINSNKYHILDCIVYFIDALPKEEMPRDEPMSADERIRILNRMAAGQNAAVKNKILQSPRNNYTILSGNGSSARKILNKIGVKTWRS